MAVSGKYGKLEIPKIGEDEPVFILRAQDLLAQGMVEIYKCWSHPTGPHSQRTWIRKSRVLRTGRAPVKCPTKHRPLNIRVCSYRDGDRTRAKFLHGHPIELALFSTLF